MLTAAGLRVDREKPISVWFRGQIVGTFFADLIVEDSVIVEAKGIRTLDAAHKAQLLNYLRATNVEVGLLLNLALNRRSRECYSTTSGSGEQKETRQRHPKTQKNGHR